MAAKKELSCIYNNLVILLALFGAEGKVINTFAGPYITEVKRMFVCDVPHPEKLKWHWYARATHYRPAHPNEFQRFTGNMSGTTLLDDAQWARAILDRRSNNQWKENAFVFSWSRAGCSAIMSNAPYLTTITGDLYSPHPCQIRPGLNVYNEKPMQVAHPNIPIMPYGEYRARLYGATTGETNPEYCFGVEVQLIPKP